MPDEIVIRFSVKDDGSPVIERVNEKLGQTKKQSEALVPGLEKARHSLTGFVSENAILIGVLTAVGTALAKSFQDYSKLAESVRDLSLVSGATAEEASRFIQVLDDFQLTAEDATAASRFLKEKGLVPNLETLVQLSNQFKQIQDPAQRLAFIQENLGRGGAKWVNILSQEESQLRATAAAIDERLIMTDKEIKAYEQQRLALDALSDSWQATKVGVGQFVGSIILENQVLTRANEIYKERGGILTGAHMQTQEYKDAVAQARAEIEEQNTALQNNGDAALQAAEDLKALEAQQKALSDAISSQIGLINSMQSAEDSFTERSLELAQSRADKEAELQDLRRQGWWEGSQQVQNALADLEEIAAAEAKLAEDRRTQALEFVSNLLEQNLAREGWTQHEFDAFTQHKLETGLWSQEVVDAARAAWMEADKITASINAIPTDKIVNIQINEFLNRYAPGTQEYENVVHAGRDAGGFGYSGMIANIGTTAQPEMFAPQQSGTFIPNSDRTSIDYGRFARVLRDVIRGG